MKWPQFILALPLVVLATVAAPVELAVTDYAGVDRTNEPVTTGVPFAKGELKDTSGLCVKSPAGQILPSQFRVISKWSDGSVRWALMDTQVDVKAGQSVKLTVDTGTPAAALTPIKTEQVDDLLVVSTGSLRFAVSKSKFNIFDSLQVGDKELITKGSPGLVVYPGKGMVKSGATKTVKVEEAGPLRTVVLVRGIYPRIHNNLLHYTVRITAYAGKQYVKVRSWLENKGRYGYYRKPEWCRFDGQALEFNLGIGAPTGVTVEGTAVPAGNEFLVSQDNPSRQWNGFKYNVKVDGKVAKTGTRTGGMTTIAGANGSVTLGVRYFWQNFNKAIELDNNRLKVWLWPRNGSWPSTRGRWKNRGGGDFKQFRQPNVYHLPGSVHKGHELILDFSKRPQKAISATLRSPLMAMASPDYYAKTEAAPGAFAPASFKLGEEAYDRRTTAWDDLAKDGINKKSASSIWSARQGKRGPVRNWYGWMNFGDNAWGGGMSSLHYDWSWIMFLNYLRQGDRGFFDTGVTMVRHLIEVDHLWSPRADKMLQRMARFEFANPYIHGGLAGGRCKPIPSHNWISGIILYFMLTGDPIAYECALSSDIGLENRIVAPFRKTPSTHGQARSSGWAILCYTSLFDLTGEMKYLDKALVLFHNNLKLKWKKKAPYHDGGLQYYYGTQSMCELHHRTQDPEVLAYIEDGAKGTFEKYGTEWPVFISNLCAYYGQVKNDPAMIKKAKDLFMAYKQGPRCYTGTGAWDKETGKYLRNGHILQHVLWKQSQKK